jgi:hypothetical protein
MSLWALMAIQYVSYGVAEYSRLHENRHIMDMGATVTYIALALVLFLVPSLN